MAKEGTINVFDLGAMFGYSAAIASKTDYAEIIKNAEVEEDLLEVISNYWHHDEMIMKLIFPEDSLIIFKEGWVEAFLNIIFPLRHYV
jgi:predicted O-methyltransferase YrrM